MDGELRHHPIRNTASRFVNTVTLWPTGDDVAHHLRRLMSSKQRNTILKGQLSRSTQAPKGPLQKTCREQSSITAFSRKSPDRTYSEGSKWPPHVTSIKTFAHLLFNPLFSTTKMAHFFNLSWCTVSPTNRTTFEVKRFSINAIPPHASFTLVVEVVRGVT